MHQAIETLLLQVSLLTEEAARLQYVSIHRSTTLSDLHRSSKCVVIHSSFQFSGLH